MKKIDINVLTGHWPFRKLSSEGICKIEERFEKSDTQIALISSINSIFYNDPFEGEQELRATIKRKELFAHVMTINPMLPGWEDDLEYAIGNYGIKAVKVFPCYHEYSMADECFLNLVDTLQRHEIPLMINIQLEDRRSAYLANVYGVSMEEVRSIVQRVTIPVILLQASMGEIFEVADLLDGNNNLYTDLSGVRNETFTLEVVLAQISENSIMYGTCYPFLCANNAIFAIEKANISDEIKEKLCFGNAERVFSIK